jgi:hypothetical protein
MKVNTSELTQEMEMSAAVADVVTTQITSDSEKVIKARQAIDETRILSQTARAIRERLSQGLIPAEGEVIYMAQELQRAARKCIVCAYDIVN